MATAFAERSDGVVFSREGVAVTNEVEAHGGGRERRGRFLRRKAFDRPAVVNATVAKAVVEPIASPLPKIDGEG